jgi:adenylylsulfate kinase-like enzyme
MKKKERGNMITIEKLAEILKEDLARMRKYVNKDVYDGDGVRDIFQEGYNYGHEVTTEEVLKLIERGGRIK